jgi:histidine triad (HIT) family protein
MSSIFSRIHDGDIPGLFVAREKEFFAILDINPLRIGHVLVIPTKEVDYLFDLDPEILAKYMLFTQRVAKAVKKVIPCKRVGVAVIGLEVPHAHIHLVPLDQMDDINFSKPKMTVPADEMESVRSAIAEAFTSLV